jgi:bile acid:Na+ symporter, BASS family
MTLAQLVPLAISVSMGLIVFALGLHARVRETTFLLRRPSLLVRSLLSMNVAMPVFAALVVAFFDLHPAVKIALLALAVSPVPPILPKKEAEAGGTPSYVIGLLIVAAILAIVLAPAAVTVLGRTFGVDVHVPASRVAPAVLITVIVPLFLGLIFRRIAPEFAARIARPVSLFATVLLVVAFLPVLFQIWPPLVAMVGNGTLAVLALFALVGLATGHLLGGPRHDDRTVLALATSTRHPGVALAIASATFPEETAVLPVLLLHLVVGTVVSLPYVSWRRRTTRRRLGRAKFMMEGKEDDIESRG